MQATVHVIGAGLAGLSAALRLASAGRRVVLHEGARQAGGRCRSYHDARLGCRIDNGNHLVLSGNRSTRAYLDLAGAPHALEEAAEAAFPFIDVRSGDRWTVRINDGPIAWWPFLPSRRPPGVGLADMLGALRILNAGAQATIADAVRPAGPALTHFWEPMAFAVMNLPPHLASARLMAATAIEAWRDGRLCRPMFAPQGLGPALVDPALERLRALGAEIRFGATLRALDTLDGRVTALRFAGEGAMPLADEDDVILAIPPARLNAVLPEARAPEEASSILNAHFRLADPAVAAQAPRLMGLVNARTQWIFAKGEVLSLTISAAEHVEGTEEAHEALLPQLWAETVAALGLPPGLQPAAARIVHERRATFRQTPEAVARRPAALTSLANLVLAGDATDTGLPATIEGAIRSGETAARLATARAGSGRKA